MGQRPRASISRVPLAQGLKVSGGHRLTCREELREGNPWPFLETVQPTGGEPAGPLLEEEVPPSWPSCLCSSAGASRVKPAGNWDPADGLQGRQGQGVDVTVNGTLQLTGFACYSVWLVCGRRPPFRVRPRQDEQVLAKRSCGPPLPVLLEALTGSHSRGPFGSKAHTVHGHFRNQQDTHTRNRECGHVL